ncbi:EthD family reductase [Phreatobacter sp. AB_2022a]|uniref:EthD family reductase n=1 Tax=Phreatobacter sp. AB_2022a TaxID=3003134 RepID=UPI0022874577|nr:EthD family reductase [Phreatobacter sp. AB_2022a]MCZ0733837.1 EthD family reductase [Phreatobacter sp. AB_2022a]
MIVRMGLLTARSDLPNAAFRRHWREVHGPLAARLPGLAGYCQNHVVDRRQLAIDHARGAWALDGLSELWFADAAAMQAAIGSPAYRPVAEDSPHFVADTKVVVGTQTVVVPRPPDAGPLIKRMSILRRRDDIDAARFADEWGRVHAPLVAAFPNLAGYTQTLVTARESAPGVAAPYAALPIDGIVEMWFRSESDLTAAFRSPAAERSQRHALDFIAEITTFLVEVHRVV